MGEKEAHAARFEQRSRANGVAGLATKIGESDYHLSWHPTTPLAGSTRRARAQKKGVKSWPDTTDATSARSDGAMSSALHAGRRWHRAGRGGAGIWGGRSGRISHARCPVSVDDDGEKTGVLIDLKKNARLWEDFYDVALARSRAKEPRESLETVKQRLRRRDKRR